MFRRTPPTCLCSSFRIVVLPRPTPPHKRTIDPTCRPADRLSKALFWAGHSWMPGWFDIKQVECLQAIALRGNLKGKGATFLSFPVWHPISNTNRKAPDDTLQVLYHRRRVKQAPRLVRRLAFPNPCPSVFICGWKLLRPFGAWAGFGGPCT